MPLALFNLSIYVGSGRQIAQATVCANAAWVLQLVSCMAIYFGAQVDDPSAAAGGLLSAAMGLVSHAAT
jgi:hypothetical protein